MKVFENGIERDATPEETADILALQSAPQPEQPRRIEWGTLIRAMTLDEAAAFECAVQAAEPRFRWLIQKTAYISTDDPDYPTLKAAFDQAYGQERSDELLPLIA